jgi:hypothetical protein
MLVRLRRDGVNFSLPALQAGLAVFALRAGPGAGALVSAGLVLILGLYGWLRSLHHSRLILDTPTSRVASAAQGYVELRGTGRPLDGTPLRSPFNGLPVLWYRIVTMRRTGQNKWVHESTDESDTSFLLDDGSGIAAVDPEGAEMLVRRKDSHRHGDRRVTQWCLIRDDPIYVIGEFDTLGSISPDFDTAAQVRDLLAEWKKDRAGLLRRFDRNGDGEIDLAEWEEARAAAKREVSARRDEVLRAPEAHVMRRPADGRLYLISDLDPQRLARRYSLWAWFHGTVFLASAAGCAWFAQHLAR